MTAPSPWTDIAGAHAAPRHAAGRLVYAVGDVHGCYEELTRLLAIIRSDARSRAGDRRPVLVFCGDYVDRGPRSHDVVEALVWLKASAPFEVRTLAGNHEEGLLAFLADPMRGAGWLQQGGDATLRSYGVDPGMDRPERLRDALLAALPSSHLRFLEGLEPFVEIGDCLFVHAGIRAGVAPAEQSRRDLLWIRDGFLDRPQDPARLVVHGHSWTDTWPRIAAGRLGIDTGAYETGVLTAVRIDGGHVSYARTAPQPAREAA